MHVFCDVFCESNVCGVVQTLCRRNIEKHGVHHKPWAVAEALQPKPPLPFKHAAPIEHNRLPVFECLGNRLSALVLRPQLVLADVNPLSVAL